MKFNLQIPSQFPRLMFIVYDGETWSSDKSLGQCVMSFRK